MNNHEAIEEALDALSIKEGEFGWRKGVSEKCNEAADTLTALRTKLSEVGSGDAEFWRAQYMTARRDYKDALKENNRLDKELEAYKSVSQPEVDHLAEAKEWAGQTEEDRDVCVHHALTSIATSLAALASCVSDQDATYSYIRTQPGG